MASLSGHHRPGGVPWIIPVVSEKSYGEKKSVFPGYIFESNKLFFIQAKVRWSRKVQKLQRGDGIAQSCKNERGTLAISQPWVAGGTRRSSLCASRGPRQCVWAHRSHFSPAWRISFREWWSLRADGDGPHQLAAHLREPVSQLLCQGEINQTPTAAVRISLSQRWCVRAVCVPCRCPDPRLRMSRRWSRR